MATAGNTQKSGPAEVSDEDMFFFDDGKPEDEKSEMEGDSGDKPTEIIPLQQDVGSRSESNSFTQESLFNVTQLPDENVSLLDGKADVGTRIDGLPVFEYAGARETIRDLQISFEQLRIEKAKDFPELENASRVSWTMEYGITKIITNPNDTIAKTIDSMVNEERYVIVADVHSHNTMDARFSEIDDEDECATRIYVVVGRLNSFFPDISVRVSNGHKFLDVDPYQIFQDLFAVLPGLVERRCNPERLRR